MVHQMGGFDVDMTREAFEIPEQYELMAMMTVGYQLAESDIPEDMKEREYNERARNSLGDNFFDGNWNTPI